MNGGVDLLKVCQEIEAKRDKIVSQLSPSDRAKAKYIFSIFDVVYDGDYAFVHSMFAGWAIFLFLFMPKLAAGELGIGILFSIPIPVVVGVIAHRALNHFYYEKKANRLVKELDERMTTDSELRQIFWKIRREGHHSDFKIANKIWKKIASKAC
jgi:hypothetical protein